MGLVGKASTLSVDQKIARKKALRRAEKLLLTRAAQTPGVPMWRKKLEEEVARDNSIPEKLVWVAVGDLLINGVFHAYGGTGDGDIISYYRGSKSTTPGS